MIQAVGRHRGLVIVGLAALVALLLLPATGGTAAPSIPGLPHVHLPKPDAKAVFDVIVEGKARDINHSQLSGTSGTCLVQEDGHVTENDTYLRGKDVKIDFLRYGHTIVMKRDRSGQLGDTSLAVKVTIHRTATGGSSFSPANPPVPCTAPGVELSKNPDCGKNIPWPGAATVLGWDGRLSLEVSPNTQRKNFNSVDRCGEDPQTGITDALQWAWPQPVKLSTGSLSSKEIFGHARSFKVFLHNSDIAPAQSNRHVSYGSLSGTVTDTGSSSATVRFIRVS
jgi:hypothetical protein